MDTRLAFLSSATVNVRMETKRTMLEMLAVGTLNIEMVLKVERRWKGKTVKEAEPWWGNRRRSSSNWSKGNQPDTPVDSSHGKKTPTRLGIVNVSRERERGGGGGAGGGGMG